MNNQQHLAEAFDYFKNQDLTNYSGEWIAICDNKVVAHDKDLQVVIKEGQKKCSHKSPTYTKIPDKNAALVL